MVCPRWHCLGRPDRPVCTRGLELTPLTKLWRLRRDWIARGLPLSALIGLIGLIAFSAKLVKRGSKRAETGLTEALLGSKSNPPPQRMPP